MFKTQIKKAVKKHSRKLGLDKVREISVSLIGKGENNINMLVLADGKKFNVRIGLRDHKNMKTEYENLQQFPVGLGPKPILFDDTKSIIPLDYIILEYIEGKVYRKWTDDMIKMHAKALARLHKRRKQVKGVDIVKWFSMHINWFEQRMQIYEDKEIAEILPKMIKFVKENRKVFSDLRNLSLCHCDPCMTNIVFTKKGIRYIDLEWSKFFDNAYDVVFIYDEHAAQSPWKMKLSGKRLDMYLETYNKIMKDKTLKKRVKIWSMIYKCTDLLFFKYKIWNWKNEKSKEFSKSQYQKHLKQVIKSLKKELY